MGCDGCIGHIAGEAVCNNEEMGTVLKIVLWRRVQGIYEIHCYDVTCGFGSYWK
jgi:hypothetical protein